ncbi:MAG: hypothetical protein ABJI22_00405, partial [Maribacter sp.]
MKQKLKLFTCLGILLLGCTKDFGDIIIDTFDFTFEGTNEDTGFVYQELTTTFDINFSRQIDGATFFFDYEILEGEGYFEDTDGNHYDGGEIELEKLNFEYKYVPTIIGKHRILVKALDYRKNQKEVELEYIIDYAPFTVLLNKVSNQFIINRENAIELTMLSENPSLTLEKDYIVTYSIEGGTGTIIYNGEDLEVNKEYAFEKGSSELIYFPTTLGTHTITVTSTSPDGLVKVVTLEVFVENIAFSINASLENNE